MGPRLWWARARGQQEETDGNIQFGASTTSPQNHTESSGFIFMTEAMPIYFTRKQYVWEASGAQVPQQDDRTMVKEDFCLFSLRE